MKWAIRFLTILALLILCEKKFIPHIKAEEFSPTVGIAINLKSSDLNEAKAGIIVSRDSNGYYISRSSNDPNIVGVLAAKTDYLYTTNSSSERFTLVVDGITQVWITTEENEVKSGDYITSSSIPGVGQKASKNDSTIGYTLEALEKSKNKNLIKVKLVLKNSLTEGNAEQNPLKKSGSILEKMLSNIQLEASQSSKTFLYVIVIIIVVLANVFGFLIFGKIAINGITAMGRNPLAQKPILKTVIINSLITIIFTLGSIIISLYLIR